MDTDTVIYLVLACRFAGGVGIGFLVTLVCSFACLLAQGLQEPDKVNKRLTKKALWGFFVSLCLGSVCVGVSNMEPQGDELKAVLAYTVGKEVLRSETVQRGVDRAMRWLEPEDKQKGDAR